MTSYILLTLPKLEEQPRGRDRLLTVYRDALGDFAGCVDRPFVEGRLSVPECSTQTKLVFEAEKNVEL
jgi:hypothetical protein